MNNQEFYYSIEPEEVEVDKEAFLEFIKEYPRPLNVDVCGISEPPSISYNDFELSDRWPYSVVASTSAYSDDPNDYYYEPESERHYTIMKNYEEVFASRTGNKTNPPIENIRKRTGNGIKEIW